jgi:YVTN family beta-propeller protein
MKQMKTRLGGTALIKTPNLFGLITLGIACAVALSLQVHAQNSSQNVAGMQTATGQFITPTALRGAVQQFLNPGLLAYPNFIAGEAVRSQLSPDGKTLAVLCAGQNSLDKPNGSTDTAASTQFIFLYDVSGAHKQSPLLTQVVPQTNSHVGLVFSPDGSTLYATGGRDDVVYVYGKGSSSWVSEGTIAFGHKNVGIGVGVNPNASGLGISTDGKTLVVANNYNDSISVIDTGSKTVRYEHDLRPYFANNEGVSGAVGGTFPFAVVVKGNNTAYVSSDRDREVVVVDISSPAAGHLMRRIPLDGNGLGMTLDPSGSRLFVAEDNADQVAVIDTTRNVVIAKIDARAPDGMLSASGNGNNGRGKDNDNDQDDHGNGHGKGNSNGIHYTGAATFAVTLSRDGRTLYAVNSGANSIAVIQVGNGHGNGNGNDNNYQVTGLIPTGYEPHDITFSADGSWLYIINGKSITGPNPGHLNGSTASMTQNLYPGGNAAAAVAAAASNEYQFQLERASLVSAPVPTGNDLDHLTQLVAANNFYTAENHKDKAVMSFLHDHIKHIIYINKENRTFDQILGDLGNGSNGSPALTQFGQAITPNFHQLARQFVTLDNYTDPGDGSMDGWSWSLQGRVTNTETITQQINYAFVNRGLSYESEGANRSVPVNWGTVAARDSVSGAAGTTVYTNATSSLLGGTVNVLTGTGNHASSDAPFGVQDGYIFNAVLNAGGTVRNYGFLVNNIGSIGTKTAPVSDPFSMGVIQVAPLAPSIASMTDVYFRGFDQNYPDLWRYNEWKREFDQYVANHNLPSLSMVRVSHDHMGSFGTALAKVSTPEMQQADDDVSVALLIQAVATSPYAADTLIVIGEDDSQDGPDHVDSHRTTTYVVGPYVKQGAVVSTHYSQVNLLRTIEDILGTQHLNLNTAFQAPMSDVFDTGSSGRWMFTAEASTILSTTDLAAELSGLNVKYVRGPDIKPKHDANYWAKVTAKFDFSDADRVPPDQFNRVIWKGMMGRKPYPAIAGLQTNRRDDDDR